jgi:hypothetical protein
MAEYKGIHGTKVQDYTTDPDNPITGQVWYNETANTLKVKAVTTAGAWSTGTDSPYTATGVNGVGSQTSALIFGGEGPPGGEVTTSILYNGTTWTTTGSLNEQMQIGMNFGTSTSALASGGERTPPGVSGKTELFNGSSWTETTDLNTARRNGGGSGADSTSGVVFGGGEHPSYSTSTEDWNGSAWTAGGSLPNGQAGSSAGDSATAALFFGGPENPSPPYVSSTTVSYNGTSWTAVNSMNTARRIGPRGASVGANSSDGAWYAGGLTGPGSLVGSTELWNGTSWSEDGDMNTARYNGGGAGNSSNALYVGGSSPSNSAATEEWTGAGSPVIRTITTD